ncbi:MAG: bifunctional hydroxymethylpyrimidine kinase/phosphomethylpyrimidine kinase [Arcobacteraceae bacterium]
MSVVLTIAGSDSSGGAGIQADLKTFEAFGVFGCSAITILTAQNTQGVTDILEVSPSFVRNQIKAIFEDFNVKALKIGMLYSNPIIDVVKEIIQNLTIPIVFDPVFISKAGSKLLHDDAILNLKSLLPYVTVVTPNLYEAKELFGYEPNTNQGLEEIHSLNCKTVIKNHKEFINNHFRSIDILYHNQEITRFDTPYLEVNNFHGTGCSYSSAIAANLAQGKIVEESIALAKKFIYLAIKHAPNIGKGSGPIDHKTAGEICLIEKT